MKLFLANEDWEMEQVRAALGGVATQYTDGWNETQDGTLLEVSNLDQLATILSELLGVGWENEGVAFIPRQRHEREVWRLLPSHGGWYYAHEERPEAPET